MTVLSGVCITAHGWIRITLDSDHEETQHFAPGVRSELRDPGHFIEESSLGIGRYWTEMWTFDGITCTPSSTSPHWDERFPRPVTYETLGANDSLST